IHPRLGQPMLEAVGGGQAIISSNVKIGGPGTSIDVPLAHKDNIWSFDHLATMTISSDDAPRPDEIGGDYGNFGRRTPTPSCWQRARLNHQEAMRQVRYPLNRRVRVIAAVRPSPFLTTTGHYRCAATS